MISKEPAKLSNAQTAFFDTNRLWSALHSQANRLNRPFAWAGHIPFAMVLTKLMEPRVIVELGTHTGNSFCSFCQAVDENQFETQCFAVDTWEGDAHAGFYDDSIFAELSTYVEDRYGKFAKLHRTTFDEAQSLFEDGTIDILHIDGLHTYEAVRHDFEFWKPKLSKRSVVLFHDTSVYDRGFGVYKLWKELSNIYPAFEFTHSHGLGVLLTGSQQSILHDFIRLLQENQPAIQQLFERTSLAALKEEAMRYQLRFSSQKQDENESLYCELFLETDNSFSESFRMIQMVELSDGSGIVSFDLSKWKNYPQRVRFDPGHQAIVIKNPSARAIDHKGHEHFLLPVKSATIASFQEDLIFGEDPWLEFDFQGIMVNTFEIQIHKRPILETLLAFVREQEVAIKDLNYFLKKATNDLNYYQDEIQKHVDAERKLWTDIQAKDFIIAELQNKRPNHKN
jgi:hypothetical protein